MRDPQFMARVQRIQEAASGRWLDILIDAGLPEVMLLRLNRPCPLCGGRDRFSFYRNKPDGHWFCRGCGYGDGLSLLQKWRSERFTDTLVYLERVLGLPEYKRQDTGQDRGGLEGGAGALQGPAERSRQALSCVPRPLLRLDLRASQSSASGLLGGAR